LEDWYGWVSSRQNYECSSYDERLCEEDGTIEHPETGVTANEACCVCGGGTLLEEPEELLECTDWEDWVTGEGYTCRDWTVDDSTCEKTDYVDRDGNSVQDACCVCGGGDDVESVSFEPEEVEPEEPEELEPEEPEELEPEEPEELEPEEPRTVEPEEPEEPRTEAPLTEEPRTEAPRTEEPRTTVENVETAPGSEGTTTQEPDTQTQETDNNMGDQESTEPESTLLGDQDPAFSSANEEDVAGSSTNFMSFDHAYRLTHPLVIWVACVLMAFGLEN